MKGIIKTINYVRIYVLNQASTSSPPAAAGWPRRCHLLSGKPSIPFLKQTLGTSLGIDLLPMASCGRTVPIVHHLCSKNCVQDEACHKAVQDQLVVHLLQSCEDPAQAASQVVEDSKGRQLSSSALVVDCEDLWNLAGNSQHTCCRLELRHLAVADNCVRPEERIERAADCGKKGTSQGQLPRIDQYKETDQNILDEDEADFTIRAEWIAPTDIVGQCNEEASSLEDVAGEGDTLGRF